MKLPCYPCPHLSACCKFGVDLISDEARKIIEKYGPRVVSEGRTCVTDAGCVFLLNNACSIYGEAFYPAVCRAFPWTHVDGTDYEGKEICPELGGCRNAEKIPAEYDGERSAPNSFL